MIPNSNLTIYNKYTDPNTRDEVYQRTEIKDVVWTSAKAVYSANLGLVRADVATVLIPFVCGENYLDPIAWQALTNKAGKWTLQRGDVIVRNIVSDEIDAGFTLTDLKATYENVLAITNVDPFDQGSLNMRFWRVGAK